MQYSLTYNSYNSWTLPLNLAIGFHIMIAVSIVVLPDLLKPRPKFEDIYTVNLVNISEVQPQQQAAQPEPQPPPPEPAKEAVAIADPVKPVEPPKPVKPVSIKPLKRKVKKKVVKQPDPQRQQEIKRKAMADALKAEEEAARQARLAAEEAARQQKLLEADYRRIQKQSSDIAKTASSIRPSGGAQVSGAVGQYRANLGGRIMQFWSLPQFKTWDDSVEAIVTVRISPSGKIMKQKFVQKSSDPTFDQFVRRTLQSAEPLPPIPRALRKEIDQDITLRFTSSGIR